GLGHDTVWSIAQDDAAVVWIGTESGMDRFDGNAWTHVTLPVRAGTAAMSVLPEKRESMWVGTNVGGALHFDHGRWSVYGEAKGIPVNCAMAMYRDREGVLWAGTQTGLRRYDEASDSFITSPGGPESWVMAMVEDRRGRLWMATKQGVFVKDRGHFASSI